MLEEGMKMVMMTSNIFDQKIYLIVPILAKFSRYHRGGRECF